MELQELQIICNDICKKYNIPNIPLFINNRYKRLFGKAFWFRNRIELSLGAISQPYEIALSILLHEIAHIITQQGHTTKFFNVSRELHKMYDIYENRTSKIHHGIIYDSSGTVVPYTESSLTVKEYKEIERQKRLSEVPD